MQPCSLFDTDLPFHSFCWLLITWQTAFFTMKLKFVEAFKKDFMTMVEYQRNIKIHSCIKSKKSKITFSKLPWIGMCRFSIVIIVANVPDISRNSAKKMFMQEHQCRISFLNYNWRPFFPMKEAALWVTECMAGTIPADWWYLLTQYFGIIRVKSLWG